MIDNAHWNDVKGITNMFLFHYGFPAATSRSLFRYGFPAVKHVITKETWPIIVRGLVEIGGYSGENAYYLFRYSLPAIKGAITKETWPIIVRGLVKMIGSAGYHARDLFRYGLSAIKDIITTETWPGLVKMTESSGKNAYYLFHYGLPAVKDMDIITEETWPGLVKMAESSGEDTIVLFRDGLPAIKDIITEETWPGLVKMAESSGKKTYYLFHYGLLAVKDIITTETWPGLVKMVESYGENSPDLFRDGLSAVKDLIRTQTSYLILDYLNELIGYCKGVEIRTLKALSPLQPLFNGFGRQLFDLLLIPTAKSQTVAAFLCFESYGEIPINALKSKSDLELLRWIVEKKSRKANDILRHIIIEGLDRRIIRIPLSKESKIIKEFLNNTPVYLIELYTEFKNIYNGNLTNKKIHYERLFKEVRKLKKEIIKGTLSKEYNQNILLAVIFSVFSPEVSIDRDLYSRAIESREDRQSDIPAVLNRISGLKVKISKGGYILKDELDVKSWNNLVEAVNEVNRKKIKIIPHDLGYNLFKEYRDGSLRQKQKQYLKWIYAFDSNEGHSLPNFNTDHETLMKYKEFIGDRLKNNLIFTLLSKAQEAYPKQFSELLGISKRDYKKLAKTLLGLWKSDAPQKEERIKSILERNAFFVEEINWQPNITINEINDWLNSLSSNVIEKELVQKIFNDLYGENYGQMQKEMEKFEFKTEGKSGFGRPFRFILSKRKMHSVAMFNMGVCVAPDDKLWNSPDFWQMIIFDEEDNGCGGVIYRTIEEDDKKYLIASIQPSQGILSSVSPEQTYARIIKFSKLMRKGLKYQNLLIPTDSVIHSNRSSIQSIIPSMNYPTLTLKRKYDFSYSPYHYQYQKFYIVD